MLPPEIPQRARLIEGASRHLELILDANQRFNLTRITSPREAAIKHVLDSVLPWQAFEGGENVLDAGTGAGFPGLPLALVLPGCKFIVSESVGKKARFVADAIQSLGIPNARLAHARAEDAVKSLPPKATIITGRALAPLSEICRLFASALKAGARALLYKGPDAQLEMEKASGEAQKHGLTSSIAASYELPDGMGARNLVELRRRTP